MVLTEISEEYHNYLLCHIKVTSCVFTLYTHIIHFFFQIHIGQYVEEEMKKYNHQRAVYEYNSMRENQDISSQGDHHRSHDGHQQIAVNEYNSVLENEDISPHESHHNSDSCQHQSAVNEYNTTPENEDITTHSQHHSAVNNLKTTPDTDDIRSYGHHKSTSETHFDFLSAKRK